MALRVECCENIQGERVHCVLKVFKERMLRDIERMVIVMERRASA